MSTGGESIGKRRRRVHGCLALAAVPLIACSAPDTATTPARALSVQLLAFLRPDTVRTIRVHPGVLYRYIWSPGGPWAVHLIQADLRGHCGLELDVLRADARESGGVGHERVTRMAARVGAGLLAAVNADFFTVEGSTVGPEVSNGRVSRRAERPTLAWRPGSEPWIGSSLLTREGIYFGWDVPLISGDGVTEAVGGFPELLDRGERVRDLEVGERPTFAAARHPRTGVGYDPASGELSIAVVDGRQPPYSAGMTLPEFARLFEALGAAEAINLDGGGSSVMVLGQVAVSRPSDATGERPVVNALALRVDTRRCALTGSR